MINYHFYDAQLRSYMYQFVSIFYGLRVRTGKGECDEEQFISVPVVIGHKDRVVAALMAGNTSNRTISLPTIAVHLQGLSLAPERRRTPGIVDQRVSMPVGGVFPDDLRTVKRAMPVPYNAELELSIYTSNTDQMHQILEQVLVLFNPDLQIQKSEGPFDWTRITRVELTGISNEENYPSGTDRRIVQWTLTFDMPIYLSIPMGVRDDLVRKIIVRIGDAGSMHVNQVDAEGNLVPFDDQLAEVRLDTTVDESDPNHYFPQPRGPVPPQPEPLP